MYISKIFTYVYMDINEENFMCRWSNKYMMMTSLTVLREITEELTYKLWKLGSGDLST